jgi:hypothetical protein
MSSAFMAETAGAKILQSLTAAVLFIVAGVSSRGEGATNQIVPSPTAKRPLTHALVLAQVGGHHAPFVAAARIWLKGFAATNNFQIHYLENTKAINTSFLTASLTVIPCGTGFRTSWAVSGMRTTSPRSYQQMSTSNRAHILACAGSLQCFR